MADWKIARKEGACRACGRSFDEGEAHLSLLVLRGDEPSREDLCQRCFETRAGQPSAGPAAPEPEGSGGGASVAAESPAPPVPPGEPADEVELWWWRTRWREEKKRGLALNMEAIEGLFLALEKRAAEAEGSTLSELRYILCLVLMRKRRLKIVRIVRDREGEAMMVRRPRRKESLRVAVHDFTPERTEELRAKLVRLFDGDEADLVALERDEPEPDSEEADGFEDEDPEDPEDPEGPEDDEEPARGNDPGVVARP